jgi:hypothetical protein
MARAPNRTCPLLAGVHSPQPFQVAPHLPYLASYGTLGPSDPRRRVELNLPGSLRRSGPASNPGVSRPPATRAIAVRFTHRGMS